MSAVYRTYCRKAPKHRSMKRLYGSCFTKPRGGLWGCRGDEWIEWCEANEFALNKWQEGFDWKLKPDAKLLTVRSASGFIKLIKKYSRPVGDLLEIDYLAVAKDYDAIEITTQPMYELASGIDYKLYNISLDEYLSKLILYRLGTAAWDVPSICVFNPNKVDIVRTFKNERR